MKPVYFLALMAACSTSPATSPGDQQQSGILDTHNIDSIATIPLRKDSSVINLSTPRIKLISRKVQLKNYAFDLSIPEGYSISVAAEVSSRLRFLEKSPDGRLFATDMRDLTDNNKGRVLIFDNWNNREKRFDSVTTYQENLRNPNQVAFYEGYIYIAETHQLTRYRYNSGDMSPTGKPEVIATFPAYGLSYKYGGWHLTRSLAFHDHKLYVSVGSSCNACVETEQERASVVIMDPDGKNKSIFAHGLRNSVGIGFIGNSLYGTGMGRDLIGPDKPEDLFQRIDSGVFYGWPYYFQYKGSIYSDDQFADSMKPPHVQQPPLAMTAFKAHSAPLGFEYFRGFSDSGFNNRVLVCLHGSTSIWRRRGYSIVMIGKGNNYTEVISGFLTGKTEKDRHGRPCDILMHDENSFFFTDDLRGVLFYVYKDQTPN